MEAMLILFLSVAHFSAAVPVNKFYPDNNLSRLRSQADDNSSDLFQLSAVFPFYGNNHTVIHVNNNGVISFKQSLAQCSPRSFPLDSNEQLIAPFWSDCNTKGSGTVRYGETTDKSILRRAVEDMQPFFDGHPQTVTFQPQFAFIATWNKVGCFNSNTDLTNTFQCVLVSDGLLSFAIFLYGDGEIQWTKQNSTGTPAQAGVNAGDRKLSKSVPEALTEAIINITLTSNVGVPGMWIYQVNEYLINETNTSVAPPTLSMTALTAPTITNLLDELSHSFENLTVETYEMSLSSLAKVVKRTACNEDVQNQNMFNIIAECLTLLTSFICNSSHSYAAINVTVLEDVFQIVSSLLQWNPNKIAVQSSSCVIKSFEGLLLHFTQQLNTDDPNIIFQSPLLTVTTELRNVTSLAMIGRSFEILDNDEIILATGNEVRPGQLSPQHTAAISLPATLFQQIIDHKSVGIFFAVYSTPVLFPVKQGNKVNSFSTSQTVVGSHVLAATVGEPKLRFENLKENVTVVFRLTTDKLVQPGSEKCASWNSTSNDWTTELCTTNVELEDGIVICNCKEVRNFAILVDICLRLQNCQPLDPKIDIPLLYVSFIGMPVSIVSLIATIITHLIFKKLRERDIAKYHVQLSLAMAFMLLVNIVLLVLNDKNVKEPYEVCVTVSVLVHYFTLVAVMWMGAEALLMFQKLVIVFRQITKTFIVFISVICWTVPIVFVIVPLSVELSIGKNSSIDIIVREDDNSTQDFCFLSHIGAFWGAFLGPIFAILIFNIIIFICVSIVLVRHTIGRATQRNETLDKNTILRMMIGISGVMFLFGLTWLFAIFTFSVPKLKLRESFQILFTVFNSLQGFFIFVFFCLFHKDARNSWKKLLSCANSRQIQREHPDRTEPARPHRVGANSREGSGRTGSDPSHRENQTNENNSRSIHEEGRDSSNESEKEQSHEQDHNSTERTRLLGAAQSDSGIIVKSTTSTKYGSMYQDRGESAPNIAEKERLRDRRL